MVVYRKAKVKQRLVKNSNGTAQDCLSRAAKASSRWETSSNGMVQRVEAKVKSSRVMCGPAKVRFCYFQ